MEKRKVLIADDELYIRLLVKSAVGRDYTVLEASDGEQAVDIARCQKPDIILMDIMMPKLDGIGACYILKSDVSTRAIPVIMVSVRTDTLDQDYSKEMGADDYLTKPFSVQALLDKTKQYELATHRTAS
jgi:two-component system alkaline phosphatase synthesis response regulator PhoP